MTLSGRFIEAGWEGIWLEDWYRELHVRAHAIEALDLAATADIYRFCRASCAISPIENMRKHRRYLTLCGMMSNGFYSGSCSLAGRYSRD